MGIGWWCWASGLRWTACWSLRELTHKKIKNKKHLGLEVEPKSPMRAYARIGLHWAPPMQRIIKIMTLKGFLVGVKFWSKNRIWHAIGMGDCPYKLKRSLRLNISLLLLWLIFGQSLSVKYFSNMHCSRWMCFPSTLILTINFAHFDPSTFNYVQVSLHTF